VHFRTDAARVSRIRGDWRSAYCFGGDFATHATTLENPMATLLVKHRVANFDKWRAVFDRLEGLREKHGFIGHSVHRDATDPNTVVIVNRVKEMAEAKNYGASPELHAAMAEAGVQGAPEISFLNDVEDLRVG
jgi:quinol monooxygenase YgiN